MTDKKELEKKILALISGTLGMSRCTLDTPILDPDHFTVLDSLTIVRLINRIDAEFGVHLADDLDFEAIETPRKLLKYISGEQNRG